MSFAIFTYEPIDAWPAGCDRIAAWAPGTFHMHNAAMWPLVEAMRSAEVLDEGLRAAYAPWPPRGLNESRSLELAAHFDGEEPIQPPPSAEERAIWERFDALREASLSQRSPRPDRVPAYKFESHDGWHVVHEEAHIIAQGLTQLLADEDALEQLLDLLDFDLEEGDSFALFVAQWACFNAVATRLGGYTLS